MCEIAVVRRTNRRFIIMFSVDLPAFDARDLRVSERGLGFEVCGAMQRPNIELPVMVVKSGKMLLSLFGRSRVPSTGVGYGGIEAKIARFHLRCRRPEQLMGSPR